VPRLQNNDALLQEILACQWKVVCFFCFYF
jgi:hypothetical protein